MGSRSDAASVLTEIVCRGCHNLPASESVDDREAISSEMVLQIDANLVLINAPYASNREVSVENSYDGEISPKGIEGEDGVSGKLRSPTLSATADGGSPSHRKGVGLKKWRRIRRYHVKDVDPFADSGKMLKRSLSSSINQSKPHFSSPDMMKHHGERSIGLESTERNVGMVPSSTFPISIPDSQFAVGSDVSVAADSDNDYRGSKTSTVAIGPKTRQPRSVHKKNQTMKATGMNLGGSALHFRPGKGQSEVSKKLRGERVKLEEENSMSSLESDSVNSMFVHNPFTASNNRKQGRKPGKYGADNREGAHQFEHEYIEEAARDNEEVIEGAVEEFSEDDDATTFLENHQESRDQYFLADSILTLQSAQEALEREVQKLGTIGREANPTGSSIDDDGEFASFASTNPETSDSHLDSQSMRQKSSSEIQVLQMIENVKVLVKKLEESKAMLAAKELHITELQTGIDHCKSIKEESVISTMDGIYRQKIEVDVGYLVLTRTMQAIKSTTGVEEQKGWVEEQVEMINKPGETESKATKLDKLVESEEVLKKMQKRVCKVSCCLMLELVLLVLVLWVFVLEFGVEPEVVVPT